MAAAIKAGFYTVGLAGGVETMSSNPMAWEGGINPRIGEFPAAQGCMLPMGVTSENVAAKYGIDRRTQVGREGGAGDVERKGVRTWRQSTTVTAACRWTGVTEHGTGTGSGLGEGCGVAWWAVVGAARLGLWVPGAPAADPQVVHGRRTAGMATPA